MSGVLASLKGAWKRVAGRRSDDSAPASTPEPEELQSSADEAPLDQAPLEETVAASAETPDYAVPDATPAEAGVVEDDTDEEAAAAEELVVETEPGLEVTPAERATVTAAEAAAAEKLASEAPTEAEPVSEPLEVASEEAAKVVKAPKAAGKAKAKKEDGAAPSPFIAPTSTEGGPDGSWTVAQLRALAKERGVRGYSSMSKAQLLGALNGPQA